MKKLMSLVALAVVGSALAASAEDSVLSANAVGYVKKTIAPGKIAAIVYPFDIIDGSVTNGIKFTEMQIANDLEGGSKVHFWNGTGWDTFSKSPSAVVGWIGLKDKVLEAGEGFFIELSGSGTEWEQVKPYTWP